jgi:hypothetical protein
VTHHPRDWSYAEHDDDADIAFDRFDKEVGELAFRVLDYLSVDLAGLETDEHGWTKVDYDAFSDLQQADHLAQLMVPPTTATLDSRQAFNERMAAFNQALPFSDAERQWLFDDPDRKQYKTLAFGTTDPKYIEAVRQSEAQLMSAGLYRVVRGRDLMQRWWSWRRETGEYADGRGGLSQARESLHGLVLLLTPELGVPESYSALQDGGEAATS